MFLQKMNLSKKHSVSVLFVDFYPVRNGYNVVTNSDCLIGRNTAVSNSQHYQSHRNINNT